MGVPGGGGLRSGRTSIFIRCACGLLGHGAGPREVVVVVANLQGAAQIPVVARQSLRVIHVLGLDGVNSVGSGSRSRGSGGTFARGRCDTSRVLRQVQGAGAVVADAELTGRSAIAPERCSPALACTGK